MEETRRRILQAALELFSQRGYTGATTREIAGAARITEVTLFRHFPSKEKLFEETVCIYLPGPSFTDLVADAKALEYREALESIAKAFLAGLREHKALIQIMYMESQQHMELMERIYAALINNLSNPLADCFREFQQMGVIRKFNPTVGANMFLGMWVAFYESEELLPSLIVPHHDPTEVIREYIDIFIMGTQLPGEVV